MLGIIGKSVRIRCSPRYCNADEIVNATGESLGRDKSKLKRKPGDLLLNVSETFRREWLKLCSNMTRHFLLFHIHNYAS